MAETDKKEVGTLSDKKSQESSVPAESEIKWVEEGLATTFSSKAPELVTGSYPLKDAAVFWTDEEHIFCRLNWELWAKVKLRREDQFPLFVLADRCQLINSIKNETAPIYHVGKLPDHIFKRAKKDSPTPSGTSRDALSKSDKPSEPQAKYLVLDLQDYSVSYLEDVPKGGWKNKHKTEKLVLRYVPSGSFMMGSLGNELGRYDNETQHKVTLTSPFYIGVFQVTQKQYKLIKGKNPSLFKGPMRPVDGVSYEDIRGKRKGAQWPENNLVDKNSFFGILRAKTKLAFDLPTEAQWEYACRAGTTTAWNNGADITDKEKDPELDKLGRYLRNGAVSIKDGTSAHAIVGSYQPNVWGLYDMHGNVREWCLDWYDECLYNEETDPKGPESGEYRVIRNGGWPDDAYFCRSASRFRLPPDTDRNDHGFRVILVL